MRGAARSQTNVAAEELKANFDAAVSKAFTEDDEAMIKANIGHQELHNLCLNIFCSGLAVIYFNSPYFLEIAHNFSKRGAIGPFGYFAFPIPAS